MVRRFFREKRLEATLIGTFSYLWILHVVMICYPFLGLMGCEVKSQSYVEPRLLAADIIAEAMRLIVTY